MERIKTMKKIQKTKKIHIAALLGVIILGDLSEAYPYT